jgi:predicted  nucleic acid-binding Zn-ribbon protein
LKELLTRKETNTSDEKVAKDAFQKRKVELEQEIEKLRKKVDAEQEKMDNVIGEIDCEMQAVQTAIDEQNRLRECAEALEIKQVAQQIAARKQEREKLETRTMEIERLIPFKTEVVAEMDASISSALEEANAVVQEVTMKHRAGCSRCLREDKVGGVWAGRAWTCRGSC